MIQMNEVCVGTVTCVNGSTARISIRSGEPSGWLHILQNAGALRVGDTVLAVYVPGWQGDGYIVGKVMA